ncbi:MAG: hypothetical protein ACK552_21470, partial [Microcystis sp.]
DAKNQLRNFNYSDLTLHNFLGLYLTLKKGVAGRHGFPFYKQLSVKSWGFVKLFGKKNLTDTQGEKIVGRNII